MVGNQNDYTIAAVLKALKILKLFDNKTREMTLTEISAKMGLGKSSTLRLLATLREEDFISYDERSKKYSLGIQLSILGGYQNNAMDLRKIVAPYLHQIADFTASICNFAVVRGDSILIVEKVFPSVVPVWAQLMVEPGTCFPLYSTGIGRLHLSQWKDEEIRNYLNGLTILKRIEWTITDKDEIFRLVLQARKNKYARNYGENEASTGGICVPIYDQEGVIMGGLSVSGMRESLFGDRLPEYIAEMRQAGLDISRKIGFQG